MFHGGLYVKPYSNIKLYRIIRNALFMLYLALIFLWFFDCDNTLKDGSVDFNEKYCK